MTASRAIAVRSLVACFGFLAYGCGGETAGDGGSDAAIDAPLDVAAREASAEVEGDADDALPPCTSPNDNGRCDGKCVDTDRDPSNCGGCGKRCCVEEVCDFGHCRAECSAGRAACPYADGCPRCFDLTTDAKHCGGCDVDCSNGSCVGGVCVAADASIDGETDAPAE